MNLSSLSSALGFNLPTGLSGLDLYNYLRSEFFMSFSQKQQNCFQSPSVEPSTHQQRNPSQNVLEHSVYQRSDYTPLSLENEFNQLFNPLNNGLYPKTLMLNSGMAAISSAAYFLNSTKKIKKLILGENCYFETKWLLEDYRDCSLVDEYRLEIPSDGDVFWFEYPINCTNPHRYPFDQQLNLSAFFDRVLAAVSKSKSPKYLVLDYTLHFLPFDLSAFIKTLPRNLTVILITSLQKHRGLGLDLTNAGALTIFSHSLSSDYEYLARIRAIMGASITQETAWLMPPLNSRLINQIITDSGLEAKKIYSRLANLNLPVKFYYSDNPEFKTSFIFVRIDDSLMTKSITTPYFSDQLIAEFVNSAKQHHSVLIQGTSFGFPFSRIFKNSERYDNTSSLRIAVGYDPDFNQNLAQALVEGVTNFVKKVSS